MGLKKKKNKTAVRRRFDRTQEVRLYIHKYTRIRTRIIVLRNRVWWHRRLRAERKTEECD